jgi:hypothetical protein
MKKLAILLVMSLSAFSVINAKTPSLLAERGNRSETGKGVKSAKSEKMSEKYRTSSNVSSVSVINFGIDFPKAEDVIWVRTDNFDQATFTNAKDGQNTIAYYDSDGNLIGSTMAKTFADLPDRAQKEIKTKYSDYSVGPIIYFNDNASNDADMVLWSRQFDDENLYFAELDKGERKIIVMITPSGGISFFKEL